MKPYSIPPLYVTDYGDYIHMSGNLPWRLRHPVQDLVNGVYLGYPLCCVLRFSWDAVWGRMSGNRRGGAWLPDGRPFVPCDVLHRGRKT